jgi:hypothetical protein
MSRHLVLLGDSILDNPAFAWERTDLMRIAILATYTPRMIMEMLMFAPILLLILFGITSVVIGGFYLLRIVVSSLRGTPYHVFHKRTVAAIQAGNLGWLAIICGPLLGLFVCLCTLPLVTFAPDITIIEFVKIVLVMIGVGVVAGIIAGGAFWVCSALLKPVRKAVNRLRGVGVWDPDLDGMP